MEQRLFDAALPELRDIATVDPGYPGINLDISDSLLQMKQPEESKDAIDAQLAVSECLSKLPSDALQTYCTAELSQTPFEGCRSQLAHIQQTAQLQAALVHLELGHSEELPVASSGAARLNPVAHSRSASLAPAPELVRPKRTPRVPTAARENAPEKSSGDRTLMNGDGTDSALGAYSKPQ